MEAVLINELPNDVRIILVGVLARDHLKHLTSVAALSTSWHRVLVDYLCSLHLAPALLQIVAPGPVESRRACLSALRRARALLTVGGYNTQWNDHAHCNMEDDGPGCERSCELVCVFRGREQLPWRDDTWPWPEAWPTHNELRQLVWWLAHSGAVHNAFNAGTITAAQYEVTVWQAYLEFRASYRGEALDGAFEQRVTERLAVVQQEVIALGGGGGEPAANAPADAPADAPAGAPAGAPADASAADPADAPANALPSVWESAPWCTLPPTTARRADLALVSGAHSTLYAVGGREGVVAHATVERLSVPRHQLLGEGWKTVSLMAEARIAPLAAAMHDRLFVAGGGSISGTSTWTSSRTAESYDCRDDSWAALPSMHDARCYAGSAVLDETWYALGGRGESGNPLHSVEAFHAGRGTWVPRRRLLRAVDAPAGAVHRGRVLAVAATAVQSYDPREGSWRFSPTGIGMVTGMGWCSRGGRPPVPPRWLARPQRSGRDDQPLARHGLDLRSAELGRRARRHG